MLSRENRVSAPRLDFAALTMVMEVVIWLCLFLPLPLLLTFLTLAHSPVLKSGITPASGAPPSSPPEWTFLRPFPVVGKEAHRTLCFALGHRLGICLQVQPTQKPELRVHYAA